jgi:proliferating cell nuclear antigen
MPNKKEEPKVPKEGILDAEVPKGTEVEFKGELKEGEQQPRSEETETDDSDQMFHLRAKSQLLKEMVDLCSIIVDDIKLKIKKNKIKINAVDAAHVCLVDVLLESGACDEYEATEMEIGIDLAKLASLLKLAKDTVTIDYDPKEKRLIIKMDTLTRKMGTIPPDSLPDASVPKLVTPGKFTLASQHFMRTLIASAQVSDHMSITVDKGYVQMATESDADTVDDKIPLGNPGLIKLETTGKFKSTYSLEYLENITKGAKETIAFAMSNDNPLQIEYPFAEGKGAVIYILAPRIESEDPK